MIGFVSIESAYKSPYTPSPPSREKAADIEQIPLELLKLLDFYKYKKLSEITHLLRQLGITEILTNDLDQPSYKPKEVAEKLITQKFVRCPVTPPQARWLVNELLAVIPQMFEQEIEADQEGRRTVDVILGRIQKMKSVINRNGKDELNNYQTNLLEWILAACKLGEIELSSEEERILREYLEPRLASSLSRLNYARLKLR